MPICSLQFTWLRGASLWLDRGREIKTLVTCQSVTDVLWKRNKPSANVETAVLVERFEGENFFTLPGRSKWIYSESALGSFEIVDQSRIPLLPFSSQQFLRSYAKRDRHGSPEERAFWRLLADSVKRSHSFRDYRCFLISLQRIAVRSFQAPAKNPSGDTRLSSPKAIPSNKS